MKYTITILLFLSVNFFHAQAINWSAMNEYQKSITYLNFGYDFALTAQLGYGYKLKAFKPIFLTADYSSPMGKDLIDDFKIRLGGQIAISKIDNFILSANVYGNFRRHETELVRMVGFGSEISATLGYYKPTWHIASKIGFDKSIITHLKHSDEMRENFPSIVNGWFIPTGGHFFYGVQGSKTIGDNFELSLQVGATNAQFKDENALLPYYGQLGLVYKFPFTKKTTVTQ